MRLQRIEFERNGKNVSIKPEEFLGLPLAERVKCILSRAIRFYGADGNEIPVPDGVRMLREQDAAAEPKPASPPPSLGGNGNGSGKGVSLAVFLKLPLDERLPMLLERRVFLCDADGRAIPLKQALQIMHEIQDKGFVEAKHGRIIVETGT